MFTRNSLLENADPHSRVVTQMGPKNKKVGPDFPDKGVDTKMKRPDNGQSRRAAFGDITNATKEQSLMNDKKKNARLLKLNTKDSTVVPCKKTGKSLNKRKTDTKSDLISWTSLSETSSISSNTSSSSGISDQVSSPEESSFSANKQALRNLSDGLPVARVEDSPFVGEDCDAEIETDSNKPEVLLGSEKSLLSVDVENYTDVFNVGIYAQHIFDYYKSREKMFCIPAYMSGSQCRITPLMRAILVDWMVEIQENFELNHETLYLAIKLTDMYLSRLPAEKEILQLIGATAVFIASKFDERCPPLIDDFIYVCDNAFDRDQFISMEIKVLQTVEFDLGIPISYSFLRRYAKVARTSMKTLTLARYILEMSLMEYDLVAARDSMIAAAALYMAQKMRNEGIWEGDVVRSSGYTAEDIRDLVVTLNTMLLARPTPQLSTIRSKYSHEIFHEVAKIVPLPTKELL